MCNSRCVYIYINACMHTYIHTLHTYIHTFHSIPSYSVPFHSIHTCIHIYVYMWFLFAPYSNLGVLHNLAAVCMSRATVEPTASSTASYSWLYRMIRTSHKE